MRGRLARRAGLASLAGAFLLAGPVQAHPFVRGGELPVDSAATLTLAIAHGCGSETSEGGEPTTDVSLEVPEWLRVLDVPDQDGWTTELEEDDAGALTVVTWTADSAQEPTPEFDIEVVASGEVGDERYLRMFQACGDDGYRWVGTPDEPADDPAVGVTLAEADPSSPPPPGPAPSEPEPPVDDAADGPTTDTDQDADGPAEDTTTDATDDPVVDATGDAAADTGPPGAEDVGGGAPGWAVPVTVGIVLIGIAAFLLGRRGPSGA